MIILFLPGVKLSLQNETQDSIQSSYDETIDDIYFEIVTCPNPKCNHVGLHVNSYYERNVVTKTGTFKLIVLQVICPECGKTHAVLPYSIIPYLKFTFECVWAVITSDKNVRSVSNLVPYETARRLIALYRRKWKQRMLSENIPLKQDLRSLSTACISAFMAQFMQNHRGFVYPLGLVHMALP